ncbi:MAG: hypothetical protein EOP51_16440 [Sphingobacteriales bacterium]|nr:MAG: hypothetical protein EOP51_16440 [Sphingobacteriales bacterium]
MKFIYLLLIACMGIGCHNTATQPNKTQHKDSTQQTAQRISPPLSERERLIAVLQQFQKDMASRNKEAIASYFHFPIRNDLLVLSYFDSAFDKQIEQNNDFIPRSLFLAYFNAIYEDQEMRGFADLFRNLQLASLKDTAVKEIKAEIANKVCMHYYAITLENDTVTLEYGVYTNEAYTNKFPNNPEMECAEYAGIWTFRFDGQKLIFDRHLVAG